MPGSVCYSCLVMIQSYQSSPVYWGLLVFHTFFNSPKTRLISMSVSLKEKQTKSYCSIAKLKICSGCEVNKQRSPECVKGRLSLLFSSPAWFLKAWVCPCYSSFNATKAKPDRDPSAQSFPGCTVTRASMEGQKPFWLSLCYLTASFGAAACPQHGAS